MAIKLYITERLLHTGFHFVVIAKDWPKQHILPHLVETLMVRGRLLDAVWIFIRQIVLLQPESHGRNVATQLKCLIVISIYNSCCRSTTWRRDISKIHIHLETPSKVP